MYLSSHFLLDEATFSQSASRAGLDNDPPIELLDNLKTAAYSMELVRLELRSNAIKVSSWYRSPEVNKLVGGAKNSAHMTGLAVDFTCPTFGDVDTIVRRIKASKIPFDQVIREYGRWVHISFAPENRRQALVIDQSGIREFA